MPTGEMKGITVRVDADLHAEIKAYLEAHEMKMGEFIALAAEDELHPQNAGKGEQSMENMRTLAFQVPEDLFQRIKDYLRRNDMTQKQFVIGLIEDELERDEAPLHSEGEEEAAGEEESEEEDQASSFRPVSSSTRWQAQRRPLPKLRRAGRRVRHSGTA